MIPANYRRDNEGERLNGLFFDGCDGVMRTIVIGLAAYIFLIAPLRVSGKRTLSKMNAFDWVVTVSLGSTLASILISKGVALAEGVAGLMILVGLQFAVTWSSVRLGWVRKILTGEPKLLLDQGRMLHDAMRHTRISEG